MSDRRGEPPRTRRRLIPVLILVAGLSGALAIHLRAGQDRDDADRYEIVNGQAYPVNPEDIGKYRHDLELYGGTWNVLADRIMRRAEGFWRGKALAPTVAVLTVVFAAGWYFIAGLPAGPEDDDEGEKRRVRLD
ncbi:MAG TPA: hypothetical protein VLY45_02945 [Nitrospiria bacterium]|nr:hypothetical protein [Nitrospiria bacterium]